MLGRRTGHGGRPDLVEPGGGTWVVGCQPRRKNGDEHEEDDDTKAEEGDAVAAQPTPGLATEAGARRLDYTIAHQ